MLYRPTIMTDNKTTAEMLQVENFDWGNDLLVNLFPLWKETILCDTTIICENEEKVQAHSILLAAASPSLYAFLRNSGQGTYEFRCTKVPCSVWKNVVTFIYTGRLDVPKEEMVPTYNLANKLAMFNFCKQLAGRLKEHGLVRGGIAATPGAKPSTESSNAKKVTEEKESNENSEDSEQKSPDPVVSKPASHTENSTGFLSLDLVSDESYFMGDDMDVDINAMSDPDEPRFATDHRYECPICFMNFKRHSSLKKHRQVCSGIIPQKSSPSYGKKIAGAPYTKKSSAEEEEEKVEPKEEVEDTLEGKDIIGRISSIQPKKKTKLSYKNLYHKTLDGRFQCNQCTIAPQKSYAGLVSHIRVKHLGIPCVRPPKKKPEDITSKPAKERKFKKTTGSQDAERKKSQDTAGKIYDMEEESQEESREAEGKSQDTDEEEKSHSEEKGKKSTSSDDIKDYFVSINHPYYSLKCRDCGKLFRNRSLLSMHVKMHHLQTKQMPSKKLGSERFGLSSLGLKLPSSASGRGGLGKLGSGGGSIFKALGGSSSHSASSSGGVSGATAKEYKCHICNRTFGKKMHLGSHMRSHNLLSGPTSPTQTKRSKMSSLYKKIVLKN